MFQKILEHPYVIAFKKNKYALPVLIAILGVIILMFWTGNPSSKRELEYETDPYEYVDILESRLEDSLCKLNSIQSCSVMITLDSFENNEYLENSTISSNLRESDEQYSRQEEYLVLNQGSGDNVVIKSKNVPTICGALIVYRGVSDVETEKNIIDAASAVLGIKSNKICVVAT